MRNRKHNYEYSHTDRTSRPSSGAKHVLKGLLVGSLVGAATALLFAPRSGDELRSDIRDKAIELRDRTTDTVKDTVSQAKSKASELKDNVLDKATEIKERGKQTVADKLNRVSDAADNGRQKVQEY